MGLILNPLLYGGLSLFWGGRIAFLDRMAICCAAVFAVISLLGMLRAMPQPVVFQTHSTINLESSRPAINKMESFMKC